jgi:diguanylate cyclase (GGDEF)-like protein
MDNETHLKGREELREAIASIDSNAIFLDIDTFQGIIFDLGYKVGDENLRQLGLYLSQLEKRENISVYRTGGDEFLAVNSEQNSRLTLRLATAIINDVQALNLPYHHPSLDRNVFTVSAVLFPFAFKDVDEYLKYSEELGYLLRVEKKVTSKYGIVLDKTGHRSLEAPPYPD